MAATTATILAGSLSPAFQRQAPRTVPTTTTRKKGQFTYNAITRPWKTGDTSHAKNRTTTRLTNNRTRPTEAKRDDKSLRRFLILSTRLSFLDFLILSLYFRSMNYYLGL